MTPILTTLQTELSEAMDKAIFAQCAVTREKYRRKCITIKGMIERAEEQRQAGRI